MMSLIARNPSNLSSSTSESPGKRSNGNQDPWSAQAEREDRTGQPVVDSNPRFVPDYYQEQFTESSFPARNSKWHDNKAWSSQEWKTDTSMCERSGQSVVTSWRETRESQSSFFRENCCPKKSDIHCHNLWQRRKLFFLDYRWVWRSERSNCDLLTQEGEESRKDSSRTLTDISFTYASSKITLEE